MYRTLVLVLTICGTSATAQNFEAMKLANELGAILAAEHYCGLSYDQGAIDAFIEGQPAAADLSFPQNLSLMIQGQAVMVEDQSESQRTAYCSGVRAAARAAGFIE